MSHTVTNSLAKECPDDLATLAELNDLPVTDPTEDQLKELSAFFWEYIRAASGISFPLPPFAALSELGQGIVVTAMMNVLPMAAQLASVVYESLQCGDDLWLA